MTASSVREGVYATLTCKYCLPPPMLWPRERLIITLIFLPIIPFFQGGWGEGVKMKIHLLPLCHSVFTQEVREHIFPLRILPDPFVDPQQL